MAVEPLPRTRVMPLGAHLGESDFAKAKLAVIKSGLNRLSLPESMHTVNVARNTGLTPAMEARLGLMFESRKKELNTSPIDDVKRVAGAAIPGVYLADTLVSAAQKTLNRIEKGSQRYDPNTKFEGVSVQRLGSKFVLPGNTAAQLRARLAIEKAGLNVRKAKV
jgi:hypothetical protein